MNLDPHKICFLIMQKLIQLGMKDVTAVETGKQNYVYTSSLHGQKRILKVTDSRHRSLKALQIQAGMLKTLSIQHSNVCPPVNIINQPSIIQFKINDISFYLIAYLFAEGVAGDIKNPNHVHLMGKSLADLHTAMRKLPMYAFQSIDEMDKKEAVVQSALRLKGAENILANVAKHFKSNEVQLLHGDFNAGNLTINEGQVRIFDFDNCVYGSRAYELANSLYMVLFDQLMHGTIFAYQEFRETFLEAYLKASTVAIDIQTINGLIGYRVLLLASWLAQPESAPLFIQQSSQLWLNTLDQFVDNFFNQFASEFES